MQKLHEVHHAARRHIKHAVADENRLLLTSLVVILSALVVINAAYIVDKIQTPPAPTPSETSSYVTSSRQTASTPAVKVTVNNVSENDTFDPAFTLADGETMLILTMSITNKTNQTQEFIPTNQLYVRTRVGDFRLMHPSMFVKNQIAASNIAPGATVTGQVSFSVPKAATNPLLYVDTGWNSEAPLVIDVLR